MYGKTKRDDSTIGRGRVLKVCFLYMRKLGDLQFDIRNKSHSSVLLVNNVMGSIATLSTEMLDYSPTTQERFYPIF